MVLKKAWPEIFAPQSLVAGATIEGSRDQSRLSNVSAKSSRRASFLTETLELEIVICSHLTQDSCIKSFLQEE